MTSGGESAAHVLLKTGSSSDQFQRGDWISFTVAGPMSGRSASGNVVERLGQGLDRDLEAGLGRRWQRHHRRPSDSKNTAIWVCTTGTLRRPALLLSVGSRSVWGLFMLASVLKRAKVPRSATSPDRRKRVTFGLNTCWSSLRELTDQAQRRPGPASPCRRRATPCVSVRGVRAFPWSGAASLVLVEGFAIGRESGLFAYALHL